MSKENPKFSDIDDYISKAPKETQEILQKIRTTVKEIVPEATETISYDMPTFNLNGTYFIYFSAWKKHISLYGVKSEESAELLKEYKSQQGTYKFMLDKPFPFDLLRQVVKNEINHSKL